MVNVAQLALDVRVERDVDGERDEGDERREGGDERGDQGDGNVRGEGEEERDEGHARGCRELLLAADGGLGGLGGKGLTDGVNGEAAGPAGADVDQRAAARDADRVSVAGVHALRVAVGQLQAVRPATTRQPRFLCFIYDCTHQIPKRSCEAEPVPATSPAFEKLTRAMSIAVR